VVPEVQIVTVGESAEFECMSVHEVSWETFNGGNLPANAEIVSEGQNRTVLRIRNTTRANTGNYICASEENMAITSKSGTLIVTGKA